MKSGRFLMPVRALHDASAGYLKNEGISIGSDYARFTSRLKADYQLRSWLKLSGNFNYAHYNANSLSDDCASTVGNIFMVKNMAPVYPLYIRDAAGNILQDPKTGMAMYDWGDGSVCVGLTCSFCRSMSSVPSPRALSAASCLTAGTRGFV